MSGTLFIVSTPIGNLADISERGRQVLEEVDLVAAEDTRHTGRMLDRLGIHQSLVSFHDHNEPARSSELVDRMLKGDQVALVCDAGTPLISDPGFRLVRLCHDRGVPVVPVPGASALLAALVVAGLPTDRFVFEGFVPAKGAAREQALERIAAGPATTVVYESPRRISSLLQALARLAGSEREAVLCRELTKKFETVLRGSLGELRRRLEDEPEQLRGEMVLVLAGAPQAEQGDEELLALAGLLRRELSSSRAARVLAAWSGRPRRELYEMLEGMGEE